MDPTTRRNNWREIIERCLRSGLPVNRWCELNKVAPSTLYSWMAKFRKEEAELFESQNTSEWIEITKEKLGLSVALTQSTKDTAVVGTHAILKASNPEKHQAPTQSAPDIRARIGSVEISITSGSEQADIEAVFKAAMSL